MWWKLKLFVFSSPINAKPFKGILWCNYLLHNNQKLLIFREALRISMYT